MSDERQEARRLTKEALHLADKYLSHSAPWAAADRLRKALLASLDREEALECDLAAERRKVEALREALAAYRSAVRSGERESEKLRAVGGAALAATDPEAAK